jgi:hypothetical protein
MPKSAFAPLQKIFDECREWLAYPQHQRRLEDEHAELSAYLEAPGQLNPKVLFGLNRIALHSGIAACEAYSRKALADLALHLTSTIGYSSLVLRLEATFSAMRPEIAGGARPVPFRDGLKAAGPAVLGQWEEAKQCAISFVEVAEKDQRLRMPESRRLRHGTVDAFLINVFSRAFSIETIFESIQPIHPVYAKLLRYWDSSSAEEFIDAMQAAVEFHIARSRDSTDSISYEFDDYFTFIFPVELLVIQALRRRDNLPSIEIGHPLVDDPWATITQLPSTHADPLLKEVESRLKNDYPLFR